MTQKEINNNYIEATKGEWDKYIAKSQARWDRMKDNIFLPDCGIDVYSRRVMNYFNKFKTNTLSQYDKWHNLLKLYKYDWRD